MAQQVTKVTEETVSDDSAPAVRGSEHSITVVQRVIYFIGSVILVLIAIRILLSLLGANQENAFASLIYDLSYPFVAPFFGLFNYNMQYGVSRFEFESLTALVVWALVIAGVARLVAIPSRVNR